MHLWVEKILKRKIGFRRFSSILRIIRSNKIEEYNLKGNGFVVFYFPREWLGYFVFACCSDIRPAKLSKFGIGLSQYLTYRRRSLDKQRNRRNESENDALLEINFKSCGDFFLQLDRAFG